MPEIIIVKYNNREYEDETIESVLSSVSIPYHLTVYENYERDGNLSTVWNDLIRRSDAEYICLLNNDTVPKGDWLEKLLSTFEDERVGAVGPISNRAGGIQGGHTGPSDIPPTENTDLSGFCLVFKKEMWEKVGGFDEKYKLYGEDSDFVRKIRKQGKKLMVRFDTFVYHHKAKSQAIAEARGKDIEAIKRESANLYRNGTS